MARVELHALTSRTSHDAIVQNYHHICTVPTLFLNENCAFIGPNMNHTFCAMFNT